ncbi:Alpha/Beta hydrolase protein [Apiospora arundinis]|uniref:Alpha/Beta hydrolase protein n=1 Tax=Apiospora arundinis TaxID=335852 RepID=A0ABR2JIK7_9PEZI
MSTNGCLLLAVQALVMVILTINAAATWPTPSCGQYDMTDFTFDSGEKLDVPLELHYQTLGQLRTAPDGSGRKNAVLILHGPTQSSAQFFSDLFAAQLSNTGQALDASKYFLVLPDGIGHGNSSKPSRASSHNSSSSRNNSSNKTGGATKMAFPKYQYSDMVRACHGLPTEHLNVPHVRLVLGISMGGMNAWMLGEEYSDFADALMPVASLPVAVGDQNWLYRKMIMELVTADPAWKGGEYEADQQPPMALRAGYYLARLLFSSPVSMTQQYPTQAAVDGFVDEVNHDLDRGIFDANDQIYAWNALGNITVPLTAVNTADDRANPPELGVPILERTVTEKMRPGLGRAVTLLISNATFGHSSYISARLWVNELRMLLSRTSSTDISF